MAFVEQIKLGHIAVWDEFKFIQYTKNTLVKLQLNKNCIENLMVNKGI